MNKKLYISPSPHIKDSDSVPQIMYSVIGALLPAGFFAVYTFGMHALWVMVVGCASAVITEWICQKAMNRPVTAFDGSAILTGLLLAYNVPAEVPLWLPAIGAMVGVLVGKQVFGGLGYNPMNPALVGRAFLMASWPVHMTVFKTFPKGMTTLSGIDSYTMATPLAAFKKTREILMQSGLDSEQLAPAKQALNDLYDSYSNLFFGNVGGCIGETSAFLLLLGAVFLLYRRVIGWKIPFAFIGTVALLSWIFGGPNELFTGDPIFHILSGGVILGAFYMATDMATTPVTFNGRLIFGVGCGVITVVIRLWGGYPEGVSYSILLMNLTTPLLDRYTRPKVFGGK